MHADLMVLCLSKWRSIAAKLTCCQPSTCTLPQSASKVQMCRGRQGLLRCRSYPAGRRSAYTSQSTSYRRPSTARPPVKPPPLDTSGTRAPPSTLQPDVERRFQKRHAQRMAPRPSGCPVKCNKKALPVLVLGALWKHAHACDPTTLCADHTAGPLQVLLLTFAVAIVATVICAMVPGLPAHEHEESATPRDTPGQAVPYVELQPRGSLTYGRHALNNLLQGPVFSEVEFLDIQDKSSFVW